MDTARLPTPSSFPRFVIDLPDSIDLVPVLGEMGIRRAFRRDEADFSGIARTPDPQDQLFLKEARHKCFVEVDESGTEAVGATIGSLEMKCTSVPISPERFRADHPFLFLIRDVRSGMILFVGRVTEPRGA